MPPVQREAVSILSLVNKAYHAPRPPPHSLGQSIDAPQRLLNVDGYPVLRLSADEAHAELDATLLVERFGLKP